MAPVGQRAPAPPRPDPSSYLRDSERWVLPPGHARRFAGRQVGARGLPSAAQATTRAGDAGSPQRLQLADGVELLGRSEGSGYVDPHHLARTGSGRVVQLTRLLFLIAQAAGPAGSTDAEVAQAVSEQYGKQVSADNVRQLATKLRALGLLNNEDGSAPQVVEPDPLLALKLRTTLLRPSGVRRLTAPLRPLFFAPIVIVALVALIAFDLWLFFVHGLAAGMREALNQPGLFLLAFTLVVLSAAFHECGHATACTVGGGRPGRMGAGIYLAWPAFYTDVTDAYRLDRKARLRTDLGGVYFSALMVLALAAYYRYSGFEPLLVIAFLMQIEIVHQMLPFLRLDGYYVVSDLVGVPDLFRRTGPVLRSMLPRQAPSPAVLELKPKVRLVVRAWVLIVAPILVFNVAMILFNFPQMLATASVSATRLAGEVGRGGASAAAAVVQLVFLVIPLAGLAWTFARLFSTAVRKGWAASAGSSVKRGGFLLGAGAVLTLLAFAWWPDGRYTPYRPGQRGTLPEQVRSVQHFGQGSPVLAPAGLLRHNPPTASPASTPAPAPTPSSAVTTPGSSSTPTTPAATSTTSTSSTSTSPSSTASSTSSTGTSSSTSTATSSSTTPLSTTTASTP